MPFISIHALRVEGDPITRCICMSSLISIHALRVEGDLGRLLSPLTMELFLSTPSGWRATDDRLRLGLDFGISIHALRVEGDKSNLYEADVLIEISIHALRVEGDVNSAPFSAAATDFYPRPPGGGRQQDGGWQFPKALISIHALRVEGDYAFGRRAGRSDQISIHALRVEGDFRYVRQRPRRN